MTRPFRRQILYIPGFDPIPPRRYRELYRREAARQARVSGYRIQMTSRPRTVGFGWQSHGAFAEGTGEAVFEVLVWDDLVQDSMQRGIAGTYLQLVTTAWAYIGSGALFRLMRLRRGPVLAALYPIAVLLVQAIIALLAASAAAWLGFGVAGW